MYHGLTNVQADVKNVREQLMYFVWNICSVVRRIVNCLRCHWVSYPLKRFILDFAVLSGGHDIYPDVAIFWWQITICRICPILRSFTILVEDHFSKNDKNINWSLSFKQWNDDLSRFLWYRMMYGCGGLWHFRQKFLPPIRGSQIPKYVESSANSSALTKLGTTFRRKF